MDKIVHFELPAKDMERARAFYSSIFGWELKDWPMPDGSKYIGARTVAVNEETHLPTEVGAINGGIVEHSETVSMPIFAINVSSIDEKVAMIEKAGGKVTRPKMDMMGMGFYAYVSDCEGNTLGLWEDAPKK